MTRNQAQHFIRHIAQQDRRQADFNYTTTGAHPGSHREMYRAAAAYYAPLAAWQAAWTALGAQTLEQTYITALEELDAHENATAE